MLVVEAETHAAELVPEPPPPRAPGVMPEHQVKPTADAKPDKQPQRNFTDPESTIAKASNGGFDQSVNGLAMVDEVLNLIVAERLLPVQEPHAHGRTAGVLCQSRLRFPEHAQGSVGVPGQRDGLAQLPRVLGPVVVRTRPYRHLDHLPQRRLGGGQVAPSPPGSMGGVLTPSHRGAARLRPVIDASESCTERPFSGCSSRSGPLWEWRLPPQDLPLRSTAFPPVPRGRGSGPLPGDLASADTRLPALSAKWLSG